ncbi:endothelin-converting enzyme 2-like [Dermacentor albipictus]|uniref:endothelin-converting enzyme 2-like n=1 Tax=Dermacentor albipictus TaxID=60249 RepID=UPI0038FC10BA
MAKIDVVAVATACVSTCLILGLFYVSVVGLWEKSGSDRNVCATEDCVSHATLLTRYIDWKLDPCDDFEAFVCSGWERSREHRDMVRSTFDALRYAWYGRFEDLLRGARCDCPPAGSRWPCTGCAGSRLTRCSPLDPVAALSYLWRSPFWITVGLLRHPHSTGSRRRVLIGPGAYLRIMRYHRRVVERSYVRYWEQFLALFYPEESERPPVDDAVVDELDAIEKDVLEELHAVNVSPRKKPALFPAPYTRLQLNRYFAWLIVQYCSPVADFSFLIGFYGTKSKAEAYLRTSCAHTVEAAYKVLALGVSTLFTARDREVIEAGFDSLVSASVRKVNETGWMDDIYSKSGAIEKLESAREAVWPSATLLEGDTLETTYAGFPEHEPYLAHHWIETRKAMKSVNRTPEYTEALLLRGVNFPDRISYDYVSNVVKLALAAVAPPAYYHNGSHAMLYGGLLFLVAKQLVKAIDDEGIKWAPNAVAEQVTFLSNSTLEAFRTKTECRRGDENEAVLPDLPAPGDHLRRTRRVAPARRGERATGP